MVRGSTRLRLKPDFVTAAGPGTVRARVLRPPTGNVCPLTPIGFRLIPFRSPLLGESRLISFPRGTEMFQFPRLPSTAYVFSGRRRRITGAGFSHSEIRGSMPVQRLTAAYRSRPRPSSAPGAKASTVCPYYLDGEPHARRSARGANTHKFGHWCSFQAPPRPAGRGSPLPRSLKTEQRNGGNVRLPSRPAVPKAAGRRPGRHLENVSLERR